MIELLEKNQEKIKEQKKKITLYLYYQILHLNIYLKMKIQESG